MHNAAFIAVAVAASTGVAAMVVPRRLRPDTAARLITALALLSVGAAVWTLLLIVIADIAQLHGVAERLEWCANVVTSHRGSFTPIGLGALGAMIAASISMVRVRNRQRRQRAPGDVGEFAVLASDRPVAYALPGRPGQVIISTGMLRSLDAEERRVLIAHERSHLHRRHHRYVRLTELAVAAMPILTPINGRLRLAIERWADEDAAVEIGDRAVVACAIAHAALASQPPPRFALAIADAGVVERVESMLAGPAPRSPLIEVLLAVVIIAGLSGLVASVVLIEPWGLAVFGLCH